MEFKAKEIANIIGGTIEGNPEAVVRKLVKIEAGEAFALSFLANPKYLNYIYTTQSSIVLVHNSFVAERPVSCTLIRVEDPYAAFAKLLEYYNKMKFSKTGISKLASIAASAKLGENSYIGDFVVIGENVTIGNNVKLFPQCYIGDDTIIGDNTILFPAVKIYHGCEIGSNCTIHAGVVIGADGFGFAPQDNNNYLKIAQIGNVIIKNNVEIGANTTIDRATLGSTIIHEGVKLDNLIQVGHNVEIGKNTVIAAQTGIAGSTKIGENCMIGGQVGFAGHSEIANDIKIGAQSGLSGNLTEAGSTWLGSPAIESGRARRSIAIFNNLPKLIERLNELERIVSQFIQKKP